jgi:hypothetical protein
MTITSLVIGPNIHAGTIQPTKNQQRVKERESSREASVALVQPNKRVGKPDNDPEGLKMVIKRCMEHASH